LTKGRPPIVFFFGTKKPPIVFFLQKKPPIVNSTYKVRLIC
jgi:hypothetical protein